LGDCRYTVSLDKRGTYLAIVTLPSGQPEGVWSLILNPSRIFPRYLNGFWAGSVLKEQQELPNWVGFSLLQRESIDVTPYQWIGDGSPLTVQIHEDKGRTALQSVYGPTLMNPGQTYTTPPLNPGFYIADFLSQLDSPRTYQGLALEGNSLYGGVVGGYLDSFTGAGYGAFLIDSPTVVDFLLLFGETFGELGSAQPYLEVYYQHEDGTRKLSWSETDETNLPPAPGDDGENTTNPPESGNGEGETTNPPTDSTVPRIIDWGTPPTLVIPTTNEETNTMWDLGAEIGGKFMSNMRILRETMDANTAIQRAVDDLKNDPDVVAVEYEPESLGIYTRLNSVLYIFLDAHYRIKPDQNIRKNPNEVFRQTLNTVNVRSVSPLSGNKNALIFSGFQDDFKHDLCPIKNALERAGFSVDFVVDIDMCGITANKGFNNPEFAEDTFHYIEKLHEYDVIYFDTHASTTGMSLGIPYDSDIFNKTYVDQSFVSESEEPFVGIRFEYIGTHFTGEKRFKNSLVFVEACNSARRKEFSFAEAFLGNGAAVYIGFNNSIPIETLDIPEFVLPFFDRMAIPGISVKTAFENPSALPTVWNFTCTNRLLNTTFGCVKKSEDNVEVVVYRSEDVDNDPEGFVLVKENLPPTAHIDSITGSDGTSIYYAMDVITFKGSGTDPEGQPITKYTWYFGEGGRHYYGQTVTYRYSKPGTYQVELWVMDSEGGVSAEDGMIQEIVVVEALPVDNPPPVNQPPIVTDISGPTTAKVNENIQFDYTYSDSNGLSDISSYHLRTSENDNRDIVSQPTVAGTTTTGSWVVKFNTPRTDHWIDIYVVDSAGNQSEPKRHYINVEALPPPPPVNQPPKLLNVNVPFTVRVNQTFPVSHEYSDPDGNQDVIAHHISMSDGYTGTFTTEELQNVVYRFETTGSHWIEVYVTDTAGNTSNHVRMSIEVIPTTVENGSPSVLGLKLPSTVAVNERFTLKYDYFDPDGVSDVRNHHIFMSDGFETVKSVPDPQSATGHAQFPGFYFATPGTHWIQVYIEDSDRNNSGPVREYVNVIGESEDTGETEVPSETENTGETEDTGETKDTGEKDDSSLTSIIPGLYVGTYTPEDGDPSPCRLLIFEEDVKIARAIFVRENVDQQVRLTKEKFFLSSSTVSFGFNGIEVAWPPCTFNFSGELTGNNTITGSIAIECNRPSYIADNETWDWEVKLSQ